MENMPAGILKRWKRKIGQEKRGNVCSHLLKQVQRNQLAAKMLSNGENDVKRTESEKKRSIR